MNRQKKKIRLVIVDPQEDFTKPTGSLYVNGAEKSIQNIADLIDAKGNEIDDIHVSLDMHHYFSIFFPSFWVDKNGKHPNPFTIISVSDVENKIWRASISSFDKWVLEYVKKLEEKNKYQLCIWPYHCLIGSKGSIVNEVLFDKLLEWEKKYNGMVLYKAKASNFQTEYYSITEAEVPDPKDDTTMLDMEFIKMLDDSDEVWITGEASSHCVFSTVLSISNEFGTESTKKLRILRDCMDAVIGFESKEKEFFDEMVKRGAIVTTSKEIISGGTHA